MTTVKTGHPYVEPRFQHEVFPAIAAGKTGRPEAIVAGGAYRTQQILFSTNFAAGDIVTVGATAFTAVASGASGNQFNVGVSLTATLDNIVTALNGSVVAEVAAFTYSNVSGTTLKALADARGVNTTTMIATKTSGGTNTPTVSVAGSADVALSLDTEFTKIDITQAVDQYFTLAAGEEGQKKSIALNAKSTGNAKVTVAGGVDSGTVITLYTAGKYTALQFLAGKWRAVANTGSVA